MSDGNTKETETGDYDYLSLEALCAVVFSSRDWHRLTSCEQEIVRRLEKGGYIIPNNPADGFVGAVSLRRDQEQLRNKQRKGNDEQKEGNSEGNSEAEDGSNSRQNGKGVGHHDGSG